MHLKTGEDRRIAVGSQAGVVYLEMSELDGALDTVVADLANAEALRIAQALIKAVRDVG